MTRVTTFNDVERRALTDGEEFVMDEDAFREFYDRTARGLWAYLARVAGDRHLADDLLQETFYRFLKASGRYESEAHRRNTLYRIATNLACDVRRRRATSGHAVVAGDEIERVPASDSPGRAERRADFLSAMSRMKPRERAILWLAYAEGESHRNIADVFGLQTASLKVTLFRARRKFAALLGRRPEGGRE
jgi:RNA polymerase sigma-70 factor (ECF subfamily)